MQTCRKDTIKCLTADREFIGDKWFAYLKKKNIPFFIRIRNNSRTNRGVKVSSLFSFLKVKESYIFPRKRLIFGHKLSLVGVKLLGDYLIIVTNDKGVVLLVRHLPNLKMGDGHRFGQFSLRISKKLNKCHLIVKTS